MNARAYILGSDVLGSIGGAFSAVDGNMHTDAPTVRAVQAKLGVVPVDGVINPKTRTAVARMNGEYFSMSSDAISDDLLGKLGIPTNLAETRPASGWSQPTMTFTPPPPTAAGVVSSTPAGAAAPTPGWKVALAAVAAATVGIGLVVAIRGRVR